VVGTADQAYLRILSGGSARVCAIAVPITSGTRNIGALTVAAHRYRAFTDDEVNLMMGLGQHLGVVVENLRMIEAMRAQMAQLDTALADLRLSQASRRDLGHLAHDLKTPLTAIQGYVGILLEGELPDSAREGLDIVSDRLEQVIVHIQAFGATGSWEITRDVVAEKSAQSHVAEISATPAADVVPIAPHADALASQEQREQTPQAFMPTVRPIVSETVVSGSPVSAPPSESWRMEAPTLPRSKPSNWLAQRLARLDRLQRIALGADGAVLLVVIIFITIVSVWQQSYW
jgi:nitrogen-specific signal transduction histidine kinase